MVERFWTAPLLSALLPAVQSARTDRTIQYGERRSIINLATEASLSNPA